MPATKPIISMEVSSLVARIYEINAMDKSEMTMSEKQALRSEVKSINRELNNRGGGLYISVGAAIIIVLLIIILL